MRIMIHCGVSALLALVASAACAHVADAAVSRRGAADFERLGSGCCRNAAGVQFDAADRAYAPDGWGTRRSDCRRVCESSQRPCTGFEVRTDENHYKCELFFAEINDAPNADNSGCTFSGISCHRRIVTDEPPCNECATILTSTSNCGSFTSIASTGTQLGMSNCDDCYEEVTLPFGFPWLGGPEQTSMIISSNGFVYFVDGNECRTNTRRSFCCSALPITSFTETQRKSYQPRRISLIQEDINPLETGEVYTLDTGSSFIVSFEDVNFYPNSSDIRVNAQLELWPNGDVELRWGDGSLTASGVQEKIAAGLEDHLVLSCDGEGTVAVPAPNAAFDSNGIAWTAYPSNECVRFSAEPACFELPECTNSGSGSGDRRSMVRRDDLQQSRRRSKRGHPIS